MYTKSFRLFLFAAALFICLSTQASDIVVGTKTDSAGTLTITNFSIQQNIISSITLLAGMTITNESPYLMTSSTASYLLFNTTNANGQPFSVAVELVQNSGTLVYKSNSGKEVHTSAKYGNCTGCLFTKTGDKITGCNCSQYSGSETGSGCNYKSSLIH